MTMTNQETVAKELTNQELIELIDNADFLVVRNCPMITKFDHENHDTYLTGDQHNLIVEALKAFTSKEAPESK